MIEIIYWDCGHIWDFKNSRFQKVILSHLLIEIIYWDCGQIWDFKNSRFQKVILSHLLIEIIYWDFGQIWDFKNSRFQKVILSHLLIEIIYWDCGQIWCFCVQNDIVRFWDPIVSCFVFLYLFFNIHVMGVSTEPGDAYSFGEPCFTSISEIHVFTQFCHIERPKDLGLRNTAYWYCCTLIIEFEWRKARRSSQR